MQNLNYIKNKMIEYKINNSIVIIPKEIKDNYEIIHILNNNILKLNYNKKIINNKIKESIQKYIKHIDSMIEFIILKNKKNLLSNIGHEFNTSFHSIITTLNLINNDKNTKIIELLYNSIIDININLDNIINYFFYKTDEFNVTNNKIELDIFLEKIKTYFNNNKYILNIKYDKSLKYIYNDKKKLQKILISLISNSIKFKSDRIYLDIYIKEGFVYFSLLDNGIGVNDVDKILDPFYKENDYEKGLGLGLTNSKKLIEKMNGDIIEIKNNVINNKGLKIVFYVKNNNNNNKGNIKNDNISLKNIKNILIIEDNVINSNLLKLMLNKKNNKYKINIINDSRLVFKHLKNNKYDLIYLDLKMPYLSGFDILDKLDKIYNNKVIIITALLNEKKVNILNNNKFVNQIIFKPIKINDI